MELPADLWAESFIYLSFLRQRAHALHLCLSHSLSFFHLGYDRGLPLSLSLSLGLTLSSFLLHMKRSHRRQAAECNS